MLPLNSQTTWTSIWGDNLRVTGETWDNGNTSNGDGCSSDWQTVEVGWTCKGGSPSSGDIWTPIWADSRIRGSETCDDGNLDNLDGWSSSCVSHIYNSYIKFIYRIKKQDGHE